MRQSAWPSRCSASRSASGSIRPARAAAGRRRSAARRPRTRAAPRARTASRSPSRPRARPRRSTRCSSSRGPRRTDRSMTTGPAAGAGPRRRRSRAPSSSSGLAGARSPAPSARLVPSARDRLGRDHELAELEAGARARRRCRPAAAGGRRARASSEITIAALGPPIPVLWIVSGSPSAATPV